MDHSNMDHSMSSHTSGMDHGDGAMCSMNMIFTWDWTNLCVIFRWWHIKSFSGFVFSLFVIALFGIFYEYLRSKVKKLENKTSPIRLEDDEINEITNKAYTGNADKVKKSIMYGVLVGYSYLMMLVFMTYNGWVMLSVVVGAGIGNYLFNTEINDSLVCH